MERQWPPEEMKCRAVLGQTAGIAGPVFKGHSSQINALCSEPGRKRIASASRDLSVRIWNVESQAMQQLTGHKDGVLSVAWNSDGQIASGAADKTIRFWNADGSANGTAATEYGVAASGLESQRQASGGGGRSTDLLFKRIMRKFRVFRDILPV